MKAPKISVLLTSYNHGRFIRETINSILTQTFADFELIIADDCSTDDSWNIIQSYDDPRIRAIRSPVNRRTPFVLESIQKCQGQYFALMHSDDIWMPEKLEKQLDFFEKNPQYAAIFTHVKGIDENGNHSPFEAAFNHTNKTRFEWLRYFFFSGNGLCHPSVLMLADRAKTLYKFGPTLVNDYRTWVRICLESEIHVLQTPLVQFRWHSQSDSGGNIATATHFEVEFYKVLECYCTLQNREDWLAVFPEFKQYAVNKKWVPLYAFAKLCLEQLHRPYVALFGMQLLISLIESDATRAELEQIYGYTSVQLREDVRKYDIFSHATRNIDYHAELKLFAEDKQEQQTITQDHQALGRYSINFPVAEAMANLPKNKMFCGTYFPSVGMPTQHTALRVVAHTPEGTVVCPSSARDASSSDTKREFDEFYDSSPCYDIIGIPYNTEKLTISSYMVGKPLRSQSELFFYSQERAQKEITVLHATTLALKKQITALHTANSALEDENVTLLTLCQEREQMIIESGLPGKLMRLGYKQRHRLAKTLRYYKKHGATATLQKVRSKFVARFFPPHARSFTANTALKPENPEQSIVIVSHDARLGGATLVALRLGKYLQEHYGYSVHFVLYQGGQKLHEFDSVGTVHLLNIPYEYEASSAAHVTNTIKRLAEAGITRVVANTVISGSLTKLFKQHGMHVVSLVHEMPKLMEQMNLFQHAQSLAEYSDAVVFGGQGVGTAFPYRDKLNQDRTLFMGQGIRLYTPPASREETRRKLRQELGIPESANIFLGCGQAEPRKGVDLMAKVLSELAPAMPNAYFVWLGNIVEQEYIEEINTTLKEQGLGDRWIVLDTFADDLAPYFYGSDMFLLCSREDPFPTVVLEAMATGLPVAAFMGTGGAEEMLAEGRGLLANHLETQDMAIKIGHFFNKPDAAMVEGAIYYAKEFSYARYASRLLSLFRHIADPKQGARYNAATPYAIQVPTPLPQANRILHIIGNFHMGGSSKLIADIVEGCGNGFTHHIITQSNPAPYAYTGITVEELPQGTPHHVFHDRISAYRPDCIHIHYWGSSDTKWYALAFDTLADLEIPILQNVNTPIAPYESSCVSKNIFVSNYTKQQFGTTPEKDIVIYPGVDFDHYFANADVSLREKNCVGMVYRLDGDKLTLQSFEPLILLCKMRPHLTILVVGAGSLFEEAQELITKNGISAQFEFLGHVPFNKLPHYYSRMSVFLAPIVAESFGQVSPIAMAMEIPVVGYNIGALSEILNSEEYLVPAGDAQAFASKVLELLDDENKRQALGKTLKQRAVSLFSVQSMVSDYQEVYSLACKETQKSCLKSNQETKSSLALCASEAPAGNSTQKDLDLLSFLITKYSQNSLHHPSHPYPSILLVLHELSLTGAPMVGKQLAKKLKAHYNVAPTVLALRDGPLRKDFEAEGIQVIIYANIATELMNPDNMQFFCSFFDAVIVNSLASSMIMQHLCFYDLPVAWWIHETAEGFRYSPPWLKFCFDMVHAIWWGSPDSEQYAKPFIKGQQCAHLLYGVEDRPNSTPASTADGGKIRIALIGSVIPRKAQDIFLSAIENLPLKLRNNAEFIIVGTPYEPDMWPEYTQRVLDLLNSVSCVTYVPSMTNDAYFDFLQSINVLVCPSTDDPMPVVVTEALMCSKLCIISQVIGQAPFLSQEEAILIEPGSVEALTNALQRVINDPSLCTSTGIKGRTVYERYFSMNQFSSNAIALVESLLGQRFT